MIKFAGCDDCSKLNDLCPAHRELYALVFTPQEEVHDPNDALHVMLCPTCEYQR